MKCKNCGSNFRTIHIPADKDRVCYHCDFNNGKAIDEPKEKEVRGK